MSFASVGRSFHPFKLPVLGKGKKSAAKVGAVNGNCADPAMVGDMRPFLGLFMAIVFARSELSWIKIKHCLYSRVREIWVKL